jgi:hypothetical protein
MVNTNKLKWVKIFEDIIKNKYNGKCYYTEKEWNWIKSQSGFDKNASVDVVQFPPDFYQEEEN